MPTLFQMLILIIRNRIYTDHCQARSLELNTTRHGTNQEIGTGRGKGMRETTFLLSSTHFYLFVCFRFPTGIAPITVVTHRDKLKNEEECKDALDEASAATGSSTSHTFFVWNYTKENKERNPEIEKMAFDILHYALMTAERAVKIMKQKEKNKQEDEMMKALEGVTVSGQVAPDSADGNLCVCFIFQK